MTCFDLPKKEGLPPKMKPKSLQIRGFPGYSINEWGQVTFERLGREVQPAVNQFGQVYVMLYRSGQQNARGLALLVASHFLPKENEAFDSVINLDGDRFNCAVDNLAWRPRWFALKYHRQFKIPSPHVPDPIKATNDEMVFPNSTLAAMHYGLLEFDIVQSVHFKYPVWPTYQVFEYI